MANGKFVAYYRVSTKRQGDSSLGLDSQKDAVAKHLNGGSWELAGEFEEVESGKRKDRPELLKALALCRSKGATLIIAKLDRLARNVLFTATLMESSVKFIALDCPDANKLTIHVMAAMAEYEATMISARTKSALAAAKARGVLLGCRTDRIAAYASVGQKASAKTRGEKAAKRNEDLLPVIVALRLKGAVTLRDLAAGLNGGGYLTPKGGQWSAVQVQRVLQRETKAA
jgi:DNA invertase Pin-like site-specific DNA recombinase